MAKQYDTDTEVMRIIAAFFVVMIHASGLGSFSAVVYNSVARFSVPVFVIISGYYLLTCPPKGTALGKKGLRLFLLMLLWSAVYYGYGLYSGSLTFTGARGLFTYYSRNLCISGIFMPLSHCTCSPRCCTSSANMLDGGCSSTP